MKNLNLLSVLCVSMGVSIYLYSWIFGNNVNSKNTVDKQNNPQSASLKSTPHSANPSATDKTKSELLTNTAKFLAGIKVDSNSSLARYQNNGSWLSHHKFFDYAWSKLTNRQLTRVKKWSQQELKQINAVSTSIFYPFSGPDFLYAYSFFPGGKEYVLVGLEPVGSVPDLASISESKREWKLQEVRSSLYAILQFSFFRTNEMKVDLRKQGVLPILYVFLARTENRILDVLHIGLDRNANIQPFQKGMISGVKIAFIPKGESQARTLYYFSTDLSNDGLKNRPEFSKFVSKIDKKVTYLKAASYLMYYDTFSQIKKQILAQSSYVLQDDSGMPLTAFHSYKWHLKFYGNYTSPIGLFANRYQPDLRKIYLTDKTVKLLNFGIGYQFGVNDSNLMLATKKFSATNP